MNGKKTLPLFVIASLILSILPSFMFANAAIATTGFNTVDSTTHVYTPLLTPFGVTKGVIVSVAGTGAVSGTTLSAYWDNPNLAWNGAAGLLNSTTVKSSGAFDVWITIPEATKGSHYVWLKDSSNNIYGPFPDGVTGFTVNPSLKLSPSSGLSSDTVTVTMYGFPNAEKITIDFIDSVPLNTPAASYPAIATATANSLGTASTTFKVPTLTSPAVLANGAYAVHAKNTTDAIDVIKSFTVGPVITLSTTSGTVGTILTITGRGFTPMAAGFAQGDVKLGTLAAYINSPTTLPATVDATGRIRLSVVIPQPTAKGTYSLSITSASGSASADFEVTDLASVTVTPSFGPVASNIIVSGTNFPKISGVDVAITLNGPITIGTATTDASGSFSKTFQVPAATENSYTMSAAAATYNILATTGFKVGTMNIILSSTSGATGKHVVISGNGFTVGTGKWNATFGSKTIISSGTVLAGGLLTGGDFEVPQLPTGTYTITVWDTDAKISLTTQFTITQTTEVTLSVDNVPANFNMTLRGRGFSVSGLSPVTFVIYNTTSTGATDFWWTMPVIQIPFVTTTTPCATNSTGEFYGHWTVDPVLSVGSYYINCTDVKGYAVTVPFTVGSIHIDASSRKASYSAGETISFNLQHSFGNNIPILGSHINIYNPNSTLVFAGDPLTGWVKTGDWYTDPYSDQTAGKNPMTLADDAQTGTWSWKWIDTTGDTVKSGTFAVTAATADETQAQITALAAQVTAVSNTVTQLSATVANVATTATAASNAATAASTAATAAATAAQAASTAATAAGSKADAATAAANAAATAAQGAQTAANNLTTLVYAAIGASLVAALAAIVALMQISRKIA